MKTVSEWLWTQKASEVMTKRVSVLRPSDRLADAVSLFLREQITGAPVVDDEGVCAGVLSATDILVFEEKRAREPEGGTKPTRRFFDIYDPGADWWCQFGRVRDEIQPRLQESVAKYMTRDIVSVVEETPLDDVIRHMVDAHVHRVLVLDNSRHLKGIITTIDVLAAALRAGRREELVCR